MLGAQDPTDYVISYHNSAADAAAGTAAIVPATSYTITGTVEEIFVRIEDSTGTCFATDSFFLNFFPISVDLGLDLQTCTTDDILSSRPIQLVQLVFFTSGFSMVFPKVQVL